MSVENGKSHGRVERSSDPHDNTPHDEANCPDCQKDIAAMTAQEKRVDCYGAELPPISESDGALYAAVSAQEKAMTDAAELLSAELLEKCLRGAVDCQLRSDRLIEASHVRNHISAQATALEAMATELETERMRLAACGVAALGYFDGCKDEYRSASLDDTLRLCTQLAQVTRERDGMRGALQEIILQQDSFTDAHFLAEIARAALKESP